MKKRNELSRLMLLVACALLLSVGCKPDDPEPEPDPKPTEKTYKVGDYYNVNGVKGIVFKISNGGKNGYIVSMNSVTSENYPWALINEITGATSENDGQGNLNKIKTMTNWSTNYPAFKYWNDQGWHIPALNELKELLNNKNVINTALKNNGGKELDQDNITSTEESENSMYKILSGPNGDNAGVIFKKLRTNTVFTRGIRKF